MKIDIITLFPEMFKGPFNESMIKRAQEKKIVEIYTHNLRKWSIDKHKTIDDKPFGGGAGMILKIEPIYKAIKELRQKDTIVILTSPQGKNFDQKLSKKLSTHTHLIIICGHYQGYDERIRTNLIDMEISIGNYILTQGELPSMVIVDSIVRLIPGVLGNKESLINETFENNLIEYPQYTHPADFIPDEGQVWSVPDILKSGNHNKIQEWRKKQSLKKTQATKL